MENLKIDTVLQGRYQIKSVLGGNALGITYIGTDTVSGGIVVIKELFPEGLCSRGQDSMEVTGNEQFYARKELFIQQMQCLARNKGLKGIVEIYDVFEEQGTAYCVMEYVEGVRLESYLTESGKKFPVKRMKELTMPIVASLSSLHQEGVIHQNISPDNLVFTNKGDLKLIGFGGLGGQQECNPATDVYALCASIYRCITGAIPQAAYERLNDDQLKKPSLLGVEIDLGDEAALMMGLQLNEEKRFRSMAAFHNAFYRSQLPPTRQAAQPVPPVKPASQPPAPAKPVPQSAPEQAQPQSDLIVVQPSQSGVAGMRLAKSDTTTVQSPQPSTIGIRSSQSDNVIIHAAPINTPQQPEKKKKGNGGLIAAVAIGGILIIVLGIAAFLFGKDMFAGADKGLKAVQETESEGEEIASEKESVADEHNIGSAYEDMIAAGDYSGALEGIIALDTTDLNTEEKDILADVLSRAMTGQYTAFEDQVNEYINTGDFDSAFLAVDEELALYDRLSAHSMAAQYIDRQRVEDKSTIVKQGHVSYLLNTRLKEVLSQGNDEEFDNLFARLQEYVDNGLLSQEELDTKKTSACTELVMTHITMMSATGAAASEIVDYIDERLYDTGNNSSVLEYWDYFKAVMGQGAGDPSTVRSASAAGYILPDSDTRNLTTDDISALSEDALRLAIYEIFARHGKTFQDQAVSQYFSAFGWYQPVSGYDESTLNTYEKYNLNLLIEYQKTKGYR